MAKKSEIPSIPPAAQDMSKASTEANTEAKKVRATLIKGTFNRWETKEGKLVMVRYCHKDRPMLHLDPDVYRKNKHRFERYEEPLDE